MGHEFARFKSKDTQNGCRFVDLAIPKQFEFESMIFIQFAILKFFLTR